MKHKATAKEFADITESFAVNVVEIGVEPRMLACMLDAWINEVAKAAAGPNRPEWSEKQRLLMQQFRKSKVTPLPEAEMERRRHLLPGANALKGEVCRFCGAPAVALIHMKPGHSSVCATHLEPYASEDICDCDPRTGKCLHHRRDAAGVMQAELAIERLQWAIQCLEKFQRLQNCDDGERLYRWAAAYADDVWIILTGGGTDKPLPVCLGVGLERVPPSQLYAARTAQLEGRPWPCRTGDEKNGVAQAAKDTPGKTTSDIPPEGATGGRLPRM